MATAAGKITASALFQALTHPRGLGRTRVLLALESDRSAELMNREPLMFPASRKTGVETLTLLEAETRTSRSAGYSRRATRDYRFRTSQGWTGWMSPAQTLILAPEDAAAVKRAEKEAYLVKEEMDAKLEAEAAEHFVAEYPDAVIRHADRPSATHPEPGWSSQCRLPKCRGHWRTGLASAAEARAAYAGHPCVTGEDLSHQKDLEEWAEVEKEQARRAELDQEAEAYLNQLRRRQAVLADRERAAERWVATEGAALEADQPEDGLEVPTKEEVLAMIGGCWAGGKLTGKALKAWADGDFLLAAALATDQKALQEAAPVVSEPETLGQVAQEVLELAEPGLTPTLALAFRELVAEPEEGPTDWVQRLRPDPAPEMVAAGIRYLEGEEMEAVRRLAYQRVAPGVLVAPIGTPAPTPEDLSDLSLALAAEALEHLEPEEVAEVAVPRCVVGDVVTIHRGDRLYQVLRLENDWGRDSHTGDVTDHTMARVAPCDPADERPAQWTSMDLLHVRGPVARVHTEEITERVRQTQALFTLEGRKGVFAVRTILVDSRRLPAATLTLLPGVQGAVPLAGHLRVGESIVVDGRCFAVTLCESGDHAVLEPAPHRLRLEEPGPAEPEARAEAIRDWEATNSPY